MPPKNSPLGHGNQHALDKKEANNAQQPRNKQKSKVKVYHHSPATNQRPTSTLSAANTHLVTCLHTATVEHQTRNQPPTHPRNPPPPLTPHSINNEAPALGPQHFYFERHQNGHQKRGIPRVEVQQQYGPQAQPLVGRVHHWQPYYRPGTQLRFSNTVQMRLFGWGVGLVGVQEYADALPRGLVHFMNPLVVSARGVGS